MDLNAHMDANGIVSNAVFTILALATVPFAQRSGLGTTSIVQVCTFLLSRGFAPATTHLMLINGSKDHFFYEKMGFTRGGTFDYDGRSVQFEGRAEFQDKAHFATIAQILETVEREHARRLATAATFIKPNEFKVFINDVAMGMESHPLHEFGSRGLNWKQRTTVCVKPVDHGAPVGKGVAINCPANLPYLRFDLMCHGLLSKKGSDVYSVQGVGNCGDDMVLAFRDLHDIPPVMFVNSAPNDFANLRLQSSEAFFHPVLRGWWQCTSVMPTSDDRGPPLMNDEVFIDYGVGYFADGNDAVGFERDTVLDTAAQSLCNALCHHPNHRLWLMSATDINILLGESNPNLQQILEILKTIVLAINTTNVSGQWSSMPTFMEALRERARHPKEVTYVIVNETLCHSDTDESAGNMHTWLDWLHMGHRKFTPQCCKVALLPAADRWAYERPKLSRVSGQPGYFIAKGVLGTATVRQWATRHANRGHEGHKRITFNAIELSKSSGDMTSISGDEKRRQSSWVNRAEQTALQGLLGPTCILQPDSSSMMRVAGCNNQPWHRDALSPDNGHIWIVILALTNEYHVGLLPGSHCDTGAEWGDPTIVASDGSPKAVVAILSAGDAVVADASLVHCGMGAPNGALYSLQAFGHFGVIPRPTDETHLVTQFDYPSGAQSSDDTIDLTDGEVGGPGQVDLLGSSESDMGVTSGSGDDDNGGDIAGPNTDSLLTQINASDRFDATLTARERKLVASTMPREVHQLAAAAAALKVVSGWSGLTVCGPTESPIGSVAAPTLSADLATAKNLVNNGGANGGDSGDAAPEVATTVQSPSGNGIVSYPTQPNPTQPCGDNGGDNGGHH